MAAALSALKTLTAERDAAITRAEELSTAICVWKHARYGVDEAEEAVKSAGEWTTALEAQYSAALRTLNQAEARLVSAYAKAEMANRAARSLLNRQEEKNNAS